jgi:hypothetical protein
MPNDDNQYEYITLHPAPGVFPVTELLETGLWAAIGPLGRQVLPILWDFHRKYPDACHPSRATLSSMAGLSPPSVTKAITNPTQGSLTLNEPDPGSSQVPEIAPWDCRRQEPATGQNRRS